MSRHSPFATPPVIPQVEALIRRLDRSLALGKAIAFVRQRQKETMDIVARSAGG